MKAIILSRFDPVYGSKIFLKSSDMLNEEELIQIPQLMAIPSKGFFIHVFENLRTANLFFKLPSKLARGRFEKLLISIITDINDDLNLPLSRELLENFATSLLNLKDAYKAFDIEMKNYKGDPEKLSEIEILLSSFYITIKPAIKALEISEQNLKERVKELTCIYGISKLSEDPNITINILLQGTLELIPSAYKFPEITCARIIYDNKEYMTENFTDTHWTQMVTKEISEKILTIQVNFLEDKPFVKEEKDLINDIGNRLKVMIEQKEAEQIIKNEKKYLEDIMESIIDGITILNTEGQIVSINEATIKQLGYTREEVIGKTPAEIFINKEEIPKFGKVIRRLIMGKPKKQQEYLVKRKDGSTFMMSVTFSLLKDSENNPKEIIAIHRDITERKKAEDDLRTSEVKYRTLSKNIPGMVYRAKPDWSTEIISNSDDICGYSIEEFDSQEINWFEIIHPDDKNKILNDSATMLKNSISLIQEYRIITKDGSTHWVEDYKTSFFNKDGSFKGIDGVVYDITERKNAEYKIKEQNEFLINVLESLKHPFYVVNVDDYSLELTNSFAMPEKSSEVLTCHAFTHKSEKPCEGVHICPLEEVKKTKKPVVVEHIHYDENGNPKYFEVHGYPIYDNDGNVIQMIESSLDISERKKIEQDLRDSEKKMKDILNNAQAVIYVKDLEGKYTFVNNLYEELFKIKKQEVIGLTDYDIFPEDMAKAFQVNDKKVIETKSPLNIEEYAPHDDGIHTYISVKFPLKTEANEIYAVCGLSTDITERKKVEQKLKESEAKNRTLFETTAEGILVADLETMKFNYANPSIRRMLGYSEEELKELHVGDIHPKYALEQVISEFEAQTRGEKELAQNIPCLRKDGNIIWADINTTKAIIDGKECNIGFFRDITARKKAEDQIKYAHSELNQIFNATISMCVIDKNYNHIRVNDRFNSFYNLKKDEAYGKKCHEIRKGHQCLTPECMVNQILKGKEPVDYEIEKELGDGTKLSYNITAFPYRSLEGEIIGVIETFMDITERKKMEQKLENSLETMRIILESLPMGIILIGYDKKIRSVNKFALDMLGMDSESELLGKICHNNICMTQKGACPILDLGEKVDKSERSILNREGTEIPIIKSVIPIMIEGEEFLLEAFIDITEPK